MSVRNRARTLRDRRVGFMLASMHTGAGLQMWPPMVQLARAYGIDLFILPGGRLKAEDRQEAVRNKLFDLISEKNLDGVVSWASSLGGFVGTEEVISFHERMRKLPLVSMAQRIPGKPVVTIDAYRGMFPLVEHMCRVHGSRRIAYIRGPEGHESADDRWRAFREYHEKAGIPLDPKLVSSPQAWSAGRTGMMELLDDRGLMPGRDFDTLMTASDYQLHDAVLTLQARGFSIPQDVLVAGFNDSPESRILSPTITTVRMPFAEQSRKAFSTLLDILSGEAVQDEYSLGSELVLRRSCGCGSVLVEAAGSMEEKAAAPASADKNHAELKRLIVEEVCKASGSTVEERFAWIEVLADDFLQATSEGNGKTDAFLHTVNRIAERFSHGDGEIESLQGLISVLRRLAGLHFPRGLRAKAESLLDKARVVLAESAERAHAYRVWKTGKIAQAIRDLEKDLIRVEDRSELGGVLAARLPALEIVSAYIVEECGGGRAELIAAVAKGSVLGQEELRSFSSREILPARYLADQRGQSWVVEPLSGDGEIYGRLVLSTGIMDGSIYEELRGALSSALQGLRTRDALKRAREAAERAETLKTRFLANVSADLRMPLQAIVEGAERGEAALAKSGRENGRASKALQEFAAIKQDAKRQLRLTDDLLDLSLSDVQELALNSRLVRPESILAAAAEASGEGIAIRAADRRLPLIQADPARLTRLLTLLMERSAPAEAECSAEGAAIVVRIKRVGTDDADSEDPFGRGPALARKLAAAHYGRLEEIAEEGKERGWELRLPFPTLGGGSVLAPGAAAGLSPEKAQRLAAEGRVPADGAYIEWECAGPAASEASAIAELAKKESCARLPFLLTWTGPEDYISGSGDLIDLVHRLAGSPVRGSILVCAGDDERRDALLAELSAAGLGNLQTAETLEDLSALRTLGPRQWDRTIIVLLGERADWLPHLRGGDLEKAPLICLCGKLASEKAAAPFSTVPRTILVNDGVFSSEEFMQFLAEILGGRAILPPYTGAIVKNAIAYLNRHLSAVISRWQLAATANVSEDYLTRVFKKELGVSPWDYLIRLRLVEARRLLRESSDSVGAIAARCGFQDQAYFCRVFRRSFGLSPTSFRS